MIKQYFYNVLLSVDQLFNAMILLGDPDVSVSSHLALAKHLDLHGVAEKKWFVDSLSTLVDFLFHNPFYTIEKDHVANSLELDEENHKAIWKWYKEIK